jgi:hypothetical protein
MKYLVICLIMVGVVFIGVRGVQIHNSEVNRLRTSQNSSQSTLPVGDATSRVYEDGTIEWQSTFDPQQAGLNK